jgi:hypothetical protein
LKEEISSVVIKITADTLSKVPVVTDFRHQLQVVLDAGGSHVEHVFH